MSATLRLPQPPVPLEIIGTPGHADCAAALSGPMRWSRWRIETQAEFYDRVTSEARRLGLGAVKFAKTGYAGGLDR